MSEQLSLNIPIFEQDPSIFVAGFVTKSSYSPYGVAQVANKIFSELGSSYRVREQMMYNYSRNGLINGSKLFGSGVQYSQDETIKFLSKFVKRTIERIS